MNKLEAFKALLDGKKITHKALKRLYITDYLVLSKNKICTQHGEVTNAFDMIGLLNDSDPLADWNLYEQELSWNWKVGDKFIDNSMFRKDNKPPVTWEVIKVSDEKIFAFAENIYNICYISRETYMLREYDYIDKL
jgi:hypothetical protein